MTEQPLHYGRYSLEPEEVPQVDTPHRRILTAQPAPEAVEVFRRLNAVEPSSMSCQPPVLWDRAVGYNVEDAFGNRWMDWSSCVLVANAGHGHPLVQERVGEILQKPLLASFVFAHEARAELCERLAALAPGGLDKVFLLTTGSEAVECAIKFMRARGRQSDPGRKVIVSFRGGFHGRTLGSQYAGGIEPLKEWIGVEDSSFIQVPFPDGYLVEDLSFDLFESTLKDAGVQPSEVAGVLSESYLGIGPDFFPVDYARSLRRWCDDNGALLCFDEVQSGFGRTGKYFCFEHYGIAPDLVACGKGISGSLPLSAVIGSSEVMDIFPGGSMTSTHSASPLSVAAALGSIEAIEKEGLTGQAAELETVLLEGMASIEARWAENVGCIRGKGLVGGIRLVRPGTLEPDSELALRVTEAAYRKGLLLFSPVGLGGGCLKIAPPLCIPRAALQEGFAVLEESLEEVLK
ncbi:MAG: aminotransferase class III-fold pyridoxal phosphate-dependent enzyme [Planctomycetota bacterium]|nr:aminotransferase class III-fold pyridoxal phosphate-dependent enzyme [Planctomycetota bacterium]